MAWELRDALKIIPAIAMAGALSACQPSQRLLLAGAGSSTGSISLASSGETIASGRPCAQGEERIFLAEVVDDFGLTIALCILPAPKRDESRIALRYSGEGGKRELSCIAKDCAGILKFSHYRRSRFTVLRLARPEKGPQNGVRRFLASSVSLSLAHVVPAPTVTSRFAASILMSSSAERSSSTWPPAG